MRRVQENARAGLVVLALLLAACTGDDSAAPSSTTAAVSTVSTDQPPEATAPSSTTVPQPACRDLAPLPDAASDPTTREADVDADSRPDSVTTYAATATPGPGDWRVRVELARGGGAEVTLPEDPAPGRVQVLGTAELGPSGAEAGGPVVFVWTSSGASARGIMLFRMRGCELAPVTRAAGGEASLLVGGSAAHQEGIRCDTAPDGTRLVEVLSEASGDGSYAVSEQASVLDGTVLSPAGVPETSSGPSPPPDAARITGCGDVS